MLGDRKAAGILCEAGPAGVFAGIGLNCNQRTFPPELEARATSLALELDRNVDRWLLLELFLGCLAAGLRCQSWLREAEKGLWKRGELVAFRPGLGARYGGTELSVDGGTELSVGGGTELFLGRLTGLDDSGSLLIWAEGEPRPRAFPSGELTATLPPYTVVA
jgi:hypothetical protein